ncbi:hypothetical protein FHETE_9351 [Fusarium heterosporum]|uniref:Uncharacterized protein n=1 Tax=Fusarium heterosporum TaxID=42747 RepID=A0A8H5WEH7_FUSHE|nr:hypothetical protein FHETE_9351 [Fusarium heterosporum]
MRFAAVFTTVTALAIGTAANPHVKDLPFNVISARVWGYKNCGGTTNDQNLGELTLHRDELGECFKFHETVRSVSQYSHADSCKLLLFSDSKCKRGKKDIKDGQCRATESHFGSYKVECK